MKVATKTLGDRALDWAIASLLDRSPSIDIHDMPDGSSKPFVFMSDYHDLRLRIGAHFSTDWRQCGPLIERHGIGLLRNSKLLWRDDDSRWQATLTKRLDAPPREGFGPVKGPTPHVAAMRCLLLSEKGEWVDVPEPLLK